MYTVRNYDSNGPYFAATNAIYQAASLRDLIFHTRLCMADGDYQIGVFDDNGECKGIWVDEAEPEPDGEDGWMTPAPAYTLYRPGDISAGMWNLMVSKFKRV